MVPLAPAQLPTAIPALLLEHVLLAQQDTISLVLHVLHVNYQFQIVLPALLLFFLQLLLDAIPANQDMLQLMALHAVLAVWHTVLLAPAMV